MHMTFGTAACGHVLQKDVTSLYEANVTRKSKLSTILVTHE